MDFVDREDIPLYIFSVAVALLGGYLIANLAPRKGRSTKVEDKTMNKVDENEGDDIEILGSPNMRMRSLSKALPVRPKMTMEETKSQTKRIIIVAHSLPVKFSKKKEGDLWDVKFDDSRNWLAAMKMLESDKDEKYEVTWVGCIDMFRLKGNPEDLKKELKKHSCVPVFIKTPELRERFFRGFCKGVLWRLFHYVMPQADYDFGKKWESRWSAYKEVNSLIADVVVSIAKPDDAIWIHGYPTLLVPEYIRKALPLAKIGMFIHTPWPTTDVVRCLPARDKILNAMMAADMIGFHTYDYARHFLSACRRILDLDFTTVAGGRLGVKSQGRTVLIEISHLGINSMYFQNLALSKTVQEKVQAIRAEYKGSKIVVGIDHLDLVKGTLVKLQAFERFMMEHEEWKGRICLIQVLFPSWNPEAEQKAIRQSVMNVVSSIQKNYGEDCIKVVDASSGQLLTVEDTIAYYNVADAALISTFWDGLNLIPYEFTASQGSDSPGALILSEFMGCSRSLSGALRVNPWSLEDVSDKLNLALSMTSKARRVSHNRRHQYVLNHTTLAWAKAFLSDLELSKSLQRDISFVEVSHSSGVSELVGFRKNFTHLLPTSVSDALEESKKRVFFFDYDGTLISEDNLQDVDDATAASDYTRRCAPSTDLLALLERLCKDDRNVVFVISGREKRQLDRWFAKVQDLGIAAEKGCFIRWPASLRADRKGFDGKVIKDEGLVGVWESAIKEKAKWKNDVLLLLKAYTERTDGSYIEEKEVSLSWHYDAADPVFGRTQASELHRYIEKIVSNSTVDITPYTYHKILEIKPKGVDKGSTILSILHSISPGGSGIAPFVLAAGDEASDERMFEGLRSALTVDSKHVKPPGSPGRFGGSITLDGDRTFTCCIGVKPSAAQYYVYDQKEFIGFLEAIAGK